MIIPDDDTIIAGRHYLTGETVNITLGGGIISTMACGKAAAGPEMIIAPGLCDL